MMKSSGVLCVISAPSGTGKSTLIQSLIRNQSGLIDIKLSISYTTRLKRFGEVHGREYYFVSINEFKSMIYADLLFEYAKVFNQYYGTAKSDIITMLKTGAHIILNVDWNGARVIRNKVSNVYTIFILPPSQQTLKLRLKNRAQDTKEMIAFRMTKAREEMCHISEYDYVIINDNFDIACQQLQSIILSQQLRCVYQKVRYEKLINRLLMSYNEDV